MRPKNVGIVALEIYFPKIYISQEELGKISLALAQSGFAARAHIWQSGGGSWREYPLSPKLIPRPCLLCGEGGFCLLNSLADI